MNHLPAAARQAEILGTLSLLTSAGTLVCCTIPALLVAVGAGAVLASTIAAFPTLVWFSEYKLWVFGIAGVLLIASGVLQWRGRSTPCPVDPVLAAACTRTRRVNAAVFSASVVIFGVGVLFAFVLPVIAAARA